MRAANAVEIRTNANASHDADLEDSPAAEMTVY